MNSPNYKRLTFEERVIIETLLKENKSQTFISNQLNRSKSTISRELKKWGTEYDAKLADWQAKDDYLNKRNSDKISSNKALKIYVYKGLLNQWSPEQISGRIKLAYPNNSLMRISHEAIYMHIYSRPQARLNKKLISLLPYQKTRRKRACAYSKRGVRIKDQLSIDERPEYIESRQEMGHWEGDLIIGLGHKSAIGTLVERTSRLTYIIKIKDRKSDTVVSGFAQKFNSINPGLTKTLTYDNGLEMAKHKEFTESTGMTVYFAHPYSSWERGTNENTNGLIRRFFPKKTDFSDINEEQLKQVQDRLNNRPRKVLNYKTPNEVFNQNST